MKCVCTVCVPCVGVCACAVYVCVRERDGVGELFVNLGDMFYGAVKQVELFSLLYSSWYSMG